MTRSLSLMLFVAITLDCFAQSTSPAILRPPTLTQVHAKFLGPKISSASLSDTAGDGIDGYEYRMTVGLSIADFTIAMDSSLVIVCISRTNQLK